MSQECDGPPRILITTESYRFPARAWAVVSLSLVEQRDRGVPFDRVPDRRRKLLELLVRLHIRVSTASVVHADDSCVRRRERVRTDSEQGPEAPLQAYKESAGL